MEGAEKAKLFLADEFCPAESLHVLQNLPQSGRVLDFHLPKQGGVTVEREMRQLRNEEMLAQQEFLDGAPLIGGVVNEDERKHSNAREHFRWAFACVRFEIEELPRM